MDCAPIAAEDTGYRDDSFILLFHSFIPRAHDHLSYRYTWADSWIVFYLRE